MNVKNKKFWNFYNQKDYKKLWGCAPFKKKKSNIFLFFYIKKKKNMGLKQMLKKKFISVFEDFL